MECCCHCEKKFSSKSNLYQHQRTSKVCLVKQGKVEEEKCGNCDKMYGKRYIRKHMERCNEKKKNNLQEQVDELKSKLVEKDDEIKRKDEDIKEIALKAVAVTNNNYHHHTTTTTNKYEFLMHSREAFSPEYIKKQVDDKFDESYFLQGQRGVAHFANDVLLTDVETGKQYYYCSDVSRKVFIMKDSSGKVKKDYKGVKLVKLIAGDIVMKSQYIYKEGIKMIDEEAVRERQTYKVVTKKKMRYLTNLCDIVEIENKNDRFVGTLSGLICYQEAEEEEEEEKVEEEDENNIYLIIEEE